MPISAADQVAWAMKLCPRCGRERRADGRVICTACAIAYYEDGPRRMRLQKAVNERRAQAVW